MMSIDRTPSAFTPSWSAPASIVATRSGWSDGEPVVVTPCVTRAATGSTAMDDIAFAGRCEFSWRTEIVTKISATGKLSFRVHTPTAVFARESLRHVPRVGDRITRTWDGVVFEIVDVGAHGRDVVICGLAEVIHRRAH